MPSRRRYDSRHQRVRKAMLRAWRPGDCCPRCQHEIDPRIDSLHADHAEDGGYLGLSHASPCRICGVRCNLAHAGIKSAELAGKQLRERRCEVCGTPFTAARGRTSGDQRTCGAQGCVSEARGRTRRREGPGQPPGPAGREW